jgi:hypothetical protein
MQALGIVISIPQVKSRRRASKSRNFFVPPCYLHRDRAMLGFARPHHGVASISRTIFHRPATATKAKHRNHETCLYPQRAASVGPNSEFRVQSSELRAFLTKPVCAPLLCASRSRNAQICSNSGTASSSFLVSQLSPRPPPLPREGESGGEFSLKCLSANLKGGGENSVDNQG